MTRKIELNILDSTESGAVKDDVLIHGRLLGVLSGTEATKVIQNEEVASRLATAEGVSLADTIKGLETLKAKHAGRDGFGRLIVAIASMKSEKETKMKTVLTRQLYLSTGIELVSQSAHKDKGLMRATFTCTDDTIIMVNEEEITND